MANRNYITAEEVPALTEIAAEDAGRLRDYLIKMVWQLRVELDRKDAEIRLLKSEIEDLRNGQ